MIRSAFGKRGLSMLALAISVAVAAIAPTGRADHPGDVLPGHSVHGDTFDEGPRRAAPEMAGTGDVHIPITTRSAAAQKFFNQGLGQLHGFWYLEAERSFRQAAALDPDCPMAFWGMAMANKTNVKRARAFIAEAVERQPKAKLSALETAWIDLVARYYSVNADAAGAAGDAKPGPAAGSKPKPDVKPDAKQKKAFVEGLAAMRKQFPNDIEIKAQSVLYIWEFKQTDQYKTADKLLNEVFADDPRHPAHHYRIHLCDGKRAKEAIESAALCGPAAPGIAHMWHMPGHTYSSLQRYADAAWQQEASARVDHAYMIRDRVMPFEIHNYAHNNEWLIRDLLMVGRVRDGIDLAKNMIELPRHPKFGASSNRGSGAEHGYTRLIDALSQYQMWAEYLDLCDTPYLPADEGNRDYQVRRLRFKGVAHAAMGQTKEAQAVVAELKQMKAKVPPATRPSAPAARPSAPSARPSAPATRPAAATGATAKNSTQSADTRPPAMVAALARAAAATRPAAASAATRPASPTTLPAVVAGQRGRTGRGSTPPNSTAIFDRAIEHVEGQIAMTGKDYPRAIKLLTAAGARQDHLSLVHLEAGDRAKAMEIAKKAAESAKGQTYPLANYVNVLYHGQNFAEAKVQFEKLQELAWAVDLTIEPYKSVGVVAAEKFGRTGDDWRAPYNPAKDLGERPPLDQLGPFRWHPSPAPAWSAPAADGSAVNLESYKGKPVVVIFYLGHGCLHCTQQLHAFAPLAKQYADAGISLIAVSTDERDALNRAWEGAKLEEAGEFPFPLVSDSQMRIFKRYNCFDDFENSPLHGTFLIDGDGDIRWQDISAEPFMDGAFLLKEAKRLLAAG